ncbi:unnamed protein product [Triticum turgidum subsp. durum]|uniref:Rx N-terminal domain-containing protein n=1 Tax=Triticum turgidum subsp. durum TaxID=4567 RepID=A0A9R1RUW4_TRITD|nr:unnamed protein product [Triticum turgidum subsp. durum]
MAELATGAVSTLLGVIGNEALRLGRVRHDVQFIQEEMESMGSFLANLSANSREHDEQVRTWMNQVRILANNCNNCIDLYLYRGNPALHRPKGGPARCLWWASWLPRKLLAQHRAAGQLRELKDRALDISNRRRRYGVEVKTESSSSRAGQLWEPLFLSATQDHEEEEEEEDYYQHAGDPLKVALSMTSMRMDKEDYFRERLDDWMGSVVKSEVKGDIEPNATGSTKLAAESKPLLPCIAFEVTKAEDTDRLGLKVLGVVEDYFKRAKDVQDKVAVLPENKDAGNIIVFVDVPTVHYDSVPLQPHKILCYILAELEWPKGTPRSRWLTYTYTREKIREIKDMIREVDVNAIHNLGDSDQLKNEEIGLGQLLRLLIYHSTSAAVSEKDKKIKSGVAILYNVIIKKTARKLKWKIEKGDSSRELPEPEYEDILKTVFPKSTSITTTAAANSPRGTSVDEEIEETVEGVKEMINELQKLDKSDKNPEVDINKTTEKKKEIVKKIRNRLKIKMMVQKIKECLRDDQKILVILKLVYDKYVCQWEETRNSLSLLECPIIGAVIVATKTAQQDKKQQPFHGPELGRMEYSLAGLYLDSVLRNTGKHMDSEDTCQILREILCRCESQEFCMKLFAHALYTKPRRSSEELSKLHRTLCDRATQKSLPSRMFKFSYMELPKEYRSCLLYLAIFPQGHTMRRSTLIGRWVAEGLITTKDSRRTSSVDEAEKCFDTLVARCLVCPTGIGATGRVKSCTVDKLVYGFITTLAIKERILETWLSHHLARHFSIFSDVRLRSSETIQDFFKKASQFYKLKGLDLEGCGCFPQSEHYLSDICRKILMLKYLSLRGTGITRLPSEINNLLELEVLDIRDTEIPMSATRNVLLRKLKRLLAGRKLKGLIASQVDSIQSSPDDKTKKVELVEVLCNGKLQYGLKRLLAGHVDSSPADYSSVQIPEKIEKMLGVEVLSNVKPKNQQDLVNIATLNDLKKLGVVINKESDLELLLNAISELLNHSLRFLSITLDITIYKGTEADSSLGNKPKDLESLTINGSRKCPKDLESTSTQMWKLLESLTENGKQLAKVTLSCTFLSQKHLKVLANLENLRCVKLRHSAYNESKLTFNKGEFKNLNKFLVEGNKMTDITFDDGAASNLEKIVLSSTSIVSISGVNCLEKLEELELKGTNNMEMVCSLFDNAKHIAKVTLRDTMLEEGDLKILASNKKMRYLVLLGKFYNGSHLTIEDEFQKLNHLIVDSSESDIIEICFTNSSPNLEKIVWSFKETVSLSGIDKLPALEELELKGDSVPNKVEEDIKKLESRLDYKHRDKPKIRRE